MKVAVNMPNNIVGTCTLLLSPEREELRIQNNQYVSIEKNVLNIGQPVNLPWNIKLELLNRNTNITTLRIRKRQETGYFMTINEVMEVFQLKYKEEIKKRQHIIKYVTVVNVNF